MRAARSMTPARIMGLAGLLACLCLSARAADPKPDATIKNASIEANVYLDDKIKADPALAADCLAEGRRRRSATLAASAGLSLADAPAL